MLYQVHLTWAGFELTKLVVIGTDCIGSCKSNYNTITTTTPSCCHENWILNFWLLQWFTCISEIKKSMRKWLVLPIMVYSQCHSTCYSVLVLCVYKSRTLSSIYFQTLIQNKARYNTAYSVGWNTVQDQLQCTFFYYDDMQNKAMVQDSLFFSLKYNTRQGTT